MTKQDEFSKAETKAKVKYENKISKNIKTNSKPIFKYLRSKLTVNKTVNSIKKSDGSYTKTPEETANEFVNFFHTVFQGETCGPLHKSCYNLNAVNYNSVLSISPDKVKKLLSEIDVSKSFGPDNIHPKLLRYLVSDTDFMLALTKMFQICAEKECIPMDRKLLTLFPFIKKAL